MTGVSVGLVTDNYFDVLGLRLARGRGFQAGESDFSIVISGAFWRRQFDRDPAAVGGRLLLSGAPFTIETNTTPCENQVYPVPEWPGVRPYLIQLRAC